MIKHKNNENKKKKVIFLELQNNIKTATKTYAQRRYVFKFIIKKNIGSDNNINGFYIKLITSVFLIFKIYLLILQQKKSHLHRQKSNNNNKNNSNSNNCFNKR